MYQHFDVSVPHRCDFATTSSLISEAAVLAASFLPLTTMIQAVSAHRGAHTEKIVRIHLGLTGAEHITRSERPQPCRLRPIDLCELSGQSHDHQHWSCGTGQVAASSDRLRVLDSCGQCEHCRKRRKMNNLSTKCTSYSRN